VTVHVIVLPGGVDPAALRYGPLQAALVAEATGSGTCAVRSRTAASVASSG
jgi:hypothetical protein